MEAFDEDWRKARGFLITFSFGTLLAWYFSADLGKLPIAGASLTIKANAEDVWLAIAIVNIYFILRCIQKFPPEKKLPDNATREGFEKALVWITNLSYQGYYIKYVEAKDREFRIHGRPHPRRVVKTYANCRLLYKVEHSSQSVDNHPIKPEDYYRRLYGNKLTISISYAYTTDSGESGTFSGYSLELTPNRYAVLFAKIVGWPRGIFFTPWMTDYILPLLLGLGSTAAALYAWTHNHAA